MEKTPDYASLFRQYVGRDPTPEDQKEIANALHARSNHAVRKASLEAALEERRGDFNADVAGVLEVEGLTQRDLEDVMRHLRPIKTTFARDWGIPTVVGVALYAAVKLGFPLVQSAYQKFSLGTGPAATKVCVEYDEPNWPPVQSSSHYKEYVTPHELSRLVEQAEKHYIHNFEICSR